MGMIERLPAVVGGVELIAVAAGLALVLTLLLNFLQDPLKRVPGPFLARFSRLWLLAQYQKGRYHLTNIELHRKYGPIVRIAPNQYSVDSFEAAKTIYGHGNHFLKEDWYLPWGHPSMRNLFNEVDPSNHAAMRRQVSNLYSMSSLVSYEPYVDQCTALLCERLSEFASAKGAVDMRHWFQCYAFDVIGLITFSKRFGHLDAGNDIGGVMSALNKQILLGSLLGLYPSWYPTVFKFLSRRAAKPGGKPTGPAYVSWFAQSQIESRRHIEPSEGHDGPEDFIGKVLRKRTEAGGSGKAASDETLLTTAGANIAAGSDTTAITLSAMLYYLCRNPEVMRKLRAEFDPQIGGGAALTFQQAQALPYLQAVIKETLRMHPATGFTMPRIVPAGGCTVAGQFIPAGTTLGINAWVAHRNRDIFGEDADIFRPERWLNQDEDRSKLLAMEGYSFAFGQGSRSCIGRNISLLEVSKCIPRILQRFDFELESKEMECVTHWFVKPTKLCFKVKERTT